MTDSILDSLIDMEILCLTIVGEARGEPIESQVAVGCVIRNRLHDNPKKYESYRDVCLEKEQFSCWNSDDPNFTILNDLGGKMVHGVATSDIHVRQCLYVAGGIQNWDIIDNTNGAKFYLTKLLYDSSKKPSWAKNSSPIIQIGSQIYFNV